MWITRAATFTQRKRQLTQGKTGFANGAKFQPQSEHEVIAAVPPIQGVLLGAQPLLTTILHSLLEWHKIAPLHASTLYNVNQ